MAWQNVEELFNRLKTHKIVSSEEILEYIEKPTIVIRIVRCAACTKLMQKRSETQAFVGYRCNYCGAFKRLQKFQNVFNTKLPILQLLRFLAYFAVGINNEHIVDLMDVSKKTIHTLVVAVQSLIQQRLEEVPVRLGGPNRIVQMYESYFGKRKYNRGRLQRYAWVFGAIDIISKEFMMRTVPNRRCESIGPLIKEYLLRESVVHTDTVC
ncbi:hypothetical protein PAPHI01_2701 [Pancytospora philotis]|nr:hypothetical protein PAPHI01_2701 [Pancytospora philotis]